MQSFQKRGKISAKGWFCLKLVFVLFSDFDQVTFQADYTY